MTADTTQPAGALPEPADAYLVVWRRDDQEWVEAHASYCPASDQARRTGGAIEDLFRADRLRAMMAERDAAREEAAGLRAELAQRNKSPSDRLHNLCAAIAEDADKSPFSREAWDELEAEAAALRRELEELRAQKPISWITNESLRSLTARGGNGSRGTVPMHAHQSTAAKIPLYARPIPPDAREGREPLTEAQICRIITSHPPDQRGILDVQAIIRDAERMHGIGPAGTSADGKTRP